MTQAYADRKKCTFLKIIVVGGKKVRKCYDGPVNDCYKAVFVKEEGAPTEIHELTDAVNSLIRDVKTPEGTEVAVLTFEDEDGEDKLLFSLISS